MAKRRSHYEIRRKALDSLGFVSYDAYLASELWATIREAVFERAKHQCELCGNKAYTAHHVTYSLAVMSGKELSQLVAICRGCHRKIEFQGDVKRQDPSSIFQAMWKRAIAKRGGGKTKAMRNASKPMCRCCRRGVRRLGRENICLACYRKHGPRVHEIAAANDTP